MRDASTRGYRSHGIKTPRRTLALLLLGPAFVFSSSLVGERSDAKKRGQQHESASRMRAGSASVLGTHPTSGA